jgi:hypothetical protein
LSPCGRQLSTTSLPKKLYLKLMLHKEVRPSLSNFHFSLLQCNKNLGSRVARQTNADQMVQNILQWLQGVYTQNSRRIRQGTLREYLPPSNTQKPRPFEPVSPPFNQGYPPSGITPQPPFPIYTNPTTGAVTGEGYPSPTNDITPPRPGYPSSPQPPFTGKVQSLPRQS